jgi:DNA topoisomerase III
MQKLKESIERGDEPPIGRTEKQVPGFRGRSGRNFRAKLKIERREDDPTRWKVDFDEEWAKGEPPKEQEDDGVIEAQQAAGDADGAEAEPAKAATG